MIVTSSNGHIKPENRRVTAAGPAGAFFCIVYGPYEGSQRPDSLATPTNLRVYYTADYGRELFRVESGVPKQEAKQSWWRKLTGRKGR